MARRIAPLSIGTIFFLILIGLTAIGGLLFSVWRVQAIYQSEQTDSLARDALLAHSFAQSVDIFLDAAVTSAATLASEAAAQPEWSRESLQRLVTRFAEQKRGSFISMYIIGADGVEIADYFPAGATEADRVAGIGVDLSDRPYFKKVMETRKPVASDAVIGRSTRRPVVVVAAPILNADGSVRAIAAGSLDLSTLQNLGERFVGEETIPVVVDASGKVVAHSDPELVRSLYDAGHLEPARHALAGETGTVKEYIGAKGIELSAAFVPVPQYGWAVWVARDTAAFAALAKQVVRGAALSLLALLVVTGIVFAVVSRFLFLPLRRMVSQAERAAGGDLDARISLAGVIPSAETVTLADRFNHMMEALKASLAVKSQFLGVVTHVFRTPMTGLKWHIEAWADRAGELQPDQAESWRECAKLMQRLQISLSNVFTGLEITQKTLHANRKPGDLGAMLEGVVANLRLMADGAKVTISSHVQKMPEMQIDEARMTKVFEALLENAILYSESGGEVRVTAAVEGSNAVVRAEDQGIGISDADMQRLFESFYRSDAAKKKYTDGIGLGLFIAKAFVELHGGTIAVMPNQPSGTVVTITVPTMRSAPDQPAP